MSYEYEKSLGTEPGSGVRQQPGVVGAPSTPWYLQPWFMLSALVVGAWVFPYRKLRGLVRNPEIVGREWDSVQGRRMVVAAQSVGGREVAIVQTGDRRVGHELIDVYELESIIDFETRQLQARKKTQAELQERQEREEQARREAASLDGFEETLTPKMRGVAVRALTKKGVTSNDVFYKSIRDLIRERVNQGWHVTGAGASRRFQAPDGRFLIQKDITKIGMDYAAFLSQRRVRNPYEGFGHGWVVVVRAPDGTHEIGRADTKDEANRIATEWMGREVDLWGLPEERVSDFGAVLAAVEAGPSRKGHRKKKIGYVGWDYVFETDLLIGPVKSLLGWGVDEFVPGWYKGEFVPVTKVIYETLKARGVEPYSHDNDIYAADTHAVAEAVEAMGRTGAAAAKVLRQAAKEGDFPDTYEM